MAMAEIEIVAYITVFLLGIFFSMLAIVMKTAIPSFLSWIIWHCFAGFHLAFLYDSVFLSFTWIYFALGTVFLIYGIALVILTVQGKPSQDLVLT